MKCKFLFLLLLLVPASMRAGEPYFCTRPGRTLYYERTRVSDGRLERTTTMHIESVRPEGDAHCVEYTFLLQGPGGKELYGGKSLMRVWYDGRGDLQTDLGATLGAVLHNLFPGAQQKSEGIPASLPSGLKEGDRLPDASCSVSAGRLTYTIRVTERSVLRKERVTVPAGSFDAVVVREHKVERGPGRNRNTWSDSWYVEGVGYVRHDTYDKNLRLDTSEVLKKY